MDFSVNRATSFHETHPELLTTFNSSYIIPLRVFKAVPNMKATFGITGKVELPALKVPVNGRLYMDIYGFYVDYGQVFEKFEKFITEGHDNSFTEDVYGKGSHNPNTESLGKSIIPDLFTPKIVDKNGGSTFEVHSGDLLNRLGLPIANVKTRNAQIKKNKEIKEKIISDYMKSHDIADRKNLLKEDNDFIEKEYNRLKVHVVPAGIPSGKYSALPMRVYQHIVNTCFRSKFLEDPEPIDFASSTSYAQDYSLKRANRSSDWFSRGFVSSMLNPIEIPIGDTAPIVLKPGAGTLYDVMFREQDSGNLFKYRTKFERLSGVDFKWDEFVDPLNPESYKAWGHYKNDTYQHTTNFQLPSVAKIYEPYAQLQNLPNNLYADLKNVVSLSLEDLRKTVALSHISSKAIYGTDLSTYLKMNFNLDLPKAHLDEPYLFGYNRIPIQINSITQTSPYVYKPEDSDEEITTFVGDKYGQSTTIARFDDKNFHVEPFNFGLIMFVGVVRHESVYQYGVNPIFNENDRFDFLNADLLGLSNVPVLEEMIYFSNDASVDKSTFNFNENYSELKYDLNVVNGEFSSDSDTPLDFYTLADIYDSAPSFDATWIKDTTKEVLDRCLTITSANSNQVHAHFEFDFKRVLPMADYYLGVDYI